MKEDVLSIYRDRISIFNEELEESKQRSTRYSYLRLGIFIVAIPVIYFLAKTSVLILITGILVLVIGFVQAVLSQQKYDALVKRSQNLIAINENEIRNLIDFSNIYYNGNKFKAPHHLYSDDLDLFGPNSLFALINRANTYEGIQLLSQSFLNKSTYVEFLNRQEAVQELEGKLAWRQEFAHSLLNIEGGYDRNLSTEIDEELSLDLSFAQQAWLNAYSIALPLIWFAVIAIYFFNTTIANSIASIFFFLNLALAIRKAKEVSSIQAHLANASIMLMSYKNAVAQIFSETWKARLIASTYNELKIQSEKNNSVEAISKLQEIIDHLDYRLNFIVAILLNGLILWDFRVIRRLARWKVEHKGSLKELFAFVGKMEALNSLATYAYNHPSYCYPAIEDEYFALDAIDIKHPLIPDTVNVGNDFSINLGEHLSIITGSNMSGKSTLLRTIGINIILGYTGTRVAAKTFHYPMVTLISYMRIKDILEESVSTFKAELDRIQLILQNLQEDPHCFLLIDEMLRGTNSKDKLTGSIGIAKRLLAERTYAMIATHDIKLAELSEQMPEGIANYYFDIDYDEGNLVFDYKVKTGICDNFNASFLLKQLGIDME